MRVSLLTSRRAYVRTLCKDVTRRTGIVSQAPHPDLHTSFTIATRRSGIPLVPVKSSMSHKKPFSTQTADWGPISVKEQWARATPKAPVAPRPSSSVLLISPQNEILLLHRVSHSSSFAAAHVFPGGHLDAYHAVSYTHLTLPTKRIV